MPTPQLRHRALQQARVQLQGQTIINRATQWPIGIGRRGLNKTLNHGARRSHVQSLAALPAILRDAILLETTINRDPIERQSIPWVHTLAARLLIGTLPYQVRCLIKETTAGFRFYDHDVTLAIVAPTDKPATSAG